MTLRETLSFSVGALLVMVVVSGSIHLEERAKETVPGPVCKWPAPLCCSPAPNLGRHPLRALRAEWIARKP